MLVKIILVSSEWNDERRIRGILRTLKDHLEGCPSSDLANSILFLTPSFLFIISVSFSPADFDF